MQTATEAARELGVEVVGIEAGAAETMCEEWYRSWAIPGADATWGGHAGSEMGTTTVAKADLHANALGPASDCHRTVAELQELRGVNFAGDGPVKLDADFQSRAPRFEYWWDAFEAEEDACLRMKRVVEQLVKAGGGGEPEPEPKRRRKGGEAEAEGGEAGGAGEEEEEAEEGSVLLVSHGGPTSHLYKTLTGEQRTPPCGYCGLFCCKDHQHPRDRRPRP